MNRKAKAWRSQELLGDVSGDEATVFCDSVAAGWAVMNEARKKEVNVRFLSRMPNMISTFSNTVPLDDRVESAEMISFCDEMGSILDECFTCLEASEELKELAPGLTREVWALAPDVVSVQFLEDEDFANPRIYVEHRNQLGKRIGPVVPWPCYLESSRNLIESIYVAESKEVQQQMGRQMERLALLLSDRRSYYWMKLIELWQKCFASDDNERVYYYGHQIKVVSDLALRFSRNGYRLAPFPQVEGDAPEGSKQRAEQAADRLVDVLSVRIEGKLTANQWDVIERLTRERVRQFVPAYERAKRYFESIINHSGRLSRRIYVTNYPKGPEMAALGSVAATSMGRAMLVGIQHGITRELLEYRDNKINDDIVFSNIGIYMSEVSERLVLQNKYRIEGSRACWTGFFFKPRVDGKPKKKTEILILEPLLIKGYWMIGGCYQDQLKGVKSFNDLYGRTLYGLRNPVAVKPYSTPAYADEPPHLTTVRRSPNLRLIEGYRDAAHSMHEYGAIVVFGVGSTVGHALASGRPVIFVDLPDRIYRMKRQVADLYEQGGFYVDGASEGWQEELRKRLDWTIDEMEGRWRNWWQSASVQLKSAIGLNEEYDVGKIESFLLKML